MTKTDPVLTVDRHTHPSGATVLLVTGELDHHTAGALMGALDELHLARTDGLVIDLSALSYCDSTGITVLVTAHHRAEQARCPLALAGLGSDLRQMFHTVGLDQIFTFHDDLDRAVDALRN
ncbi:STAS domain-containing protein [Streptomyces abyssomicinicus]|uniref:STAS domain-containing protein n=1 Tax=Streptomyces abyssomicinicus TaxID=574929 RepID=UPI001250AEE6|nr:STAS domain-containing protein [Streptomyces abyssomicinicus]